MQPKLSFVFTTDGFFLALEDPAPVIKRFAAFRRSRHGIEILVNNAGVLEGGSVLDIPGANMRSQFEISVFGPLLLTQAIAKQMVKRGRGRIVWVSSREGLNTNPSTGIYAASKHAVEAIRGDDEL